MDVEDAKEDTNPVEGECSVTETNFTEYIDNMEESLKETLNVHEDSDSDISKRSSIRADAMLSALPVEYEIPETPTSPIKIVEQPSFEMTPPPIETTPQTTIEPEAEFCNIKALQKHATTYQLEKFEKNFLIIFNQEKIDGYRPRLGTEKDMTALTNTFKRFGFEVIPHTDLTRDGIFDELNKLDNINFTDYGCVIIAVLTHGTKYGLLRAKDKLYNETEIIKQLNICNKPTLITKPRILIVQACRGKEEPLGVSTRQTGKIRKDREDDEVVPYTLPVDSDMLILHSSYAGKPSYRDEQNGSWFIQSLCKKINHMSPAHDLETILTEVKREVAIEREHEEHNRRTYELDINKQMPVVTSTLIRKLYFKTFKDASSEVTITPDVKQYFHNEVLDTAMPITPIFVPNETCNCFLFNFPYMKDSLRHFLEENPEDKMAISFLNFAETCKDDIIFNDTKETITKEIYQYLMQHKKHFHFCYKSLFFKK